MSVSSQRGHFAWAIQAAKIGLGGTFTPSSYTWQRHRAIAMDFGAQELIDALPQEVGGTLFVSTTYKNGAFGGGSAQIAPRLQGSFGHLLYAAAGAKAITATAGAAPATTRFYVDPNDETAMPWLALRKYVPGATGTTGITEYFYDARINALTLNIPTIGPASAEVSFLGREFTSADDEVLGTSSTYEDGSGLGLSCNGSVVLPGFSTELGSGGAGGKFTAAQIILANGVSQPQQEMIIGSYHPDDFTPLSRAAAIRLVYKWADPQMYRKLVYGGTAGGWSPVIQTSACKIKTASAANIPTKNAPYSLEFNAASVDWRISNPQLAAGQLLQVEMIGTVKGTTNATPTWYFDLVNVTDYSTLP